MRYVPWFKDGDKRQRAFDDAPQLALGLVGLGRYLGLGRPRRTPGLPSADQCAEKPAEHSGYLGNGRSHIYLIRRERRHHETSETDTCNFRDSRDLHLIKVADLGRGFSGTMNLFF